MKGHWWKVVPLDCSFLFFTARIKQALDHQFYSSALKKKLLTTLLHSSDLSPPRDVTLACLISVTLAAHSHFPNSTDWCRTSSNTPSTCPKDFSTLPLSPNPQAVLLCLLSNTNNSSCFQLFVSIFPVKAVVTLCSVCPWFVIVWMMDKEDVAWGYSQSWPQTINLL